MTRSKIPAILLFSGILVLVLTSVYLSRNALTILEWSAKSKDNDPIKRTANARPQVAASIPNCSPPVPYDYKGADQEDPKLIEYIRKDLMVQPSIRPYKLAHPNAVHFSQFNQSKIANKMLKGMKHGFFVEVGAADGEHLSNSLFFERELGWRGLLIEATPKFFQAIQAKNRNAYSIYAALSVNTFASDLTFRANLGTMSKLGNHGIQVKGLPFYSVLKALNVEVVDFLSLDIESFEVKVLKTIPWDKIKFRLMCIEVAHLPEGKDFLRKFLEGKGYKFLGYGYLDIDGWYAHPELLQTDVNPLDRV